MSGRRILFLDRDGTLNEEPPDEQVDSLEKIRLMPGVVPALLELKRAGFGFVMVTNQDGLGTPSLPREKFERAHRFLLELFASQGIEFDAVFICPHFKREDCACRKPKLGMVQQYLEAHPIDTARSYMIGDRDTDLEFAANLGMPGLRVRLDGDAQETWPAIAARILGAARRAHVRRKTKETRGRGRGRSVARGAEQRRHRAGILRSHARADRQARRLCAAILSAPAICTSTSTTPSRTARWRWGRRCARRWATSAASPATDSCSPWTRPRRRWRSICPAGRISCGKAASIASASARCPPNWCRISFARWPKALGAALHLRVRGENSHHMIESCFKGVGRSLRQAIRLEGAELPSTKGVL